MGILAKIEAFLDGKKTYIISILSGAIGIYMSLGHTIPDFIWVLLGAAGLGAVRSAIGTQPKV